MDDDIRIMSGSLDGRSMSKANSDIKLQVVREPLRSSEGYMRAAGAFTSREDNCMREGTGRSWGVATAPLAQEAVDAIYQIASRLESMKTDQ